LLLLALERERSRGRSGPDISELAPVLVLLLDTLLEFLRDDASVGHVRLFDSSIGTPLVCL
jgi:hypothetical protein